MGKSITFGTYTPKKEDDWVDKFYPYIDLHNPCGKIERVEDVVLDNGNLKSMYRNHKVPVVYLAEDTERLIWLTIVDGSEEGSSNNDGNITLELSDESNFTLSTKSYSAKYKWKLKTKIKATAGSKGKTAYIDIYSEDWITNKKQCGRIKIAVLSDKDIFSKTEADKLKSEILYIVPFVDNATPSEYVGNYCMQAAERGLSELLGNTTDFYSVERGTHKRKNNIGFSGKTAIDRGTKFKSLGFVKSSLTFDGYSIDQTKRASIVDSNTYRNVMYDIISFAAGKDKDLFNYFNNEIKEKIGFHTYYFTVTGGFHTLLLLIDNSDPCEIKYEVYDQHGLTSSNGKLEDIAEGIRKQASWTFANSCLNRYIIGKSDKWDSTTTFIWKIQRK